MSNVDDVAATSNEKREPPDVNTSLPKAAPIAAGIVGKKSTARDIARVAPFEASLVMMAMVGLLVSDQLTTAGSCLLRGAYARSIFPRIANA